MSLQRVTEGLRDNRDTADASGNAPKPNPENWMGEIEEFASEISSDLNSITEMLGERSITLGRSTASPTATPTEAWTPPKNSNGKADPVDADTASSDDSNNKDGFDQGGTDGDRKQLSSLKQRLAEMKSANDDFGHKFSKEEQGDD